MATRIGAEIQEMHTLSQGFKAKSSDLQDLIKFCRGALDGTFFVGDAATRFGHEFTQYEGALRNMAKSLEEQSVYLEQKAQQAEVFNS